MKSGQPVNANKGVTPTPAKEKAPSLTKGKRMSSIVVGGQPDRLFAAEYLPAPEVTFARSPIVVNADGTIFAEKVPEPEPHERVCFIPFIIHGLGFPFHPFVRGLLHFYGLQLHHLLPNLILHMACYVTLCEAFLSCQPHFGLWSKLFCVKL